MVFEPVDSQKDKRIQQLQPIRGGIGQVWGEGGVIDSVDYYTYDRLAACGCFARSKALFHSSSVCSSSTNISCLIVHAQAPAHMISGSIISRSLSRPQ